MSLLEGRAGSTNVSDGTTGAIRLTRESALVVGNANGFYAEAARRGRVFVASTPLAGITAAAAHLSPVAAAAATLLSLHNPPSSGKLLSILRVTGDFLSGTVEVGQYCWNFHGASSVSTAQAAALTRCAYVDGAASPSGGSVAKAFANEAITGGLVGLQGPAIGMWATAGTQRFDQLIDGMIVVPQGCMVTVAAPTNATSTVSAWSIWYEELAA